MNTINEIEILGDVETTFPRIFQLVSEIEKWPQILPHYRYMRILERSDNHKLADFGASRDGFPVKWQARQELFPLERRITFVHTGGLTRGMWVEWRLEPSSTGVTVKIEHELHYRIPIIGDLIARYIVGDLFITNIANKTLRCFKDKIEEEQRS